MKHFVIALLVGFLAGPSVADDDPWFGADKWIHFGASATITGVGYGVSSIKLREPWQRALAGGALSLTIGGLKELADATNGSVASWRDMTWNCLGTIAGAGLSMGIDAIVTSLGARDYREPLAEQYQVVVDSKDSMFSLMIAIPIS